MTRGDSPPEERRATDVERPPDDDGQDRQDGRNPASHATRVRDAGDRSSDSEADASTRPSGAEAAARSSDSEVDASTRPPAHGPQGGRGGRAGATSDRAPPPLARAATAVLIIGAILAAFLYRIGTAGAVQPWLVALVSVLGLAAAAAVLGPEAVRVGAAAFGRLGP